MPPTNHLHPKFALSAQSATIRLMALSSQPRRSIAARLLIASALLLPYAGLCFPRFYARQTPALFGFPFFYWYQFAWVVLTSVLLGIVYRARQKS